MVRLDSTRLRWLAATVAAGMVLVLLMAVLTGKPHHWNQLLQDWLLRQTTTESLPDDYLLVALDEPSIQLDMLEPEEVEASRALQLMRAGFPWSREVYALLAERLLNAGARIVIFDILLTSARADDEALADVLRRYPDKIVLASNFEFIAANDGSEAAYYFPPTPLLAEAAGRGIGLATFPHQSTIRYSAIDATAESLRGKPSALTDTIRPFLGTVAARLLGQTVTEDLRPRRFRYSLPQTVRKIPLYEIFVPAYWEKNFRNGEVFRDRVVLVGATAEGLKDYFFTPFGRLAGPEIQLHALAAIQRQQWLEQAGAPLTLAGIPLAGAMVFLLAWAQRHSGKYVFGVLLGATAWLGLCAVVLYTGSYFLPIATPLLTWLICGFGTLATDVALERRERSRLRGTLERYVSKDVVREIVENPDSFLQTLGGQRKEVVVLFSDLQGFTSASENLDPAAVVALLNSYFGEMVEAVFSGRGTLDKFIGDALMATWGGIRQATPQEDTGLAVTTALEMARRLDAFNAERKLRNEAPWTAGIGICQGPAIFGNIGSQQKMEPTVIGDTVNLASRIEGLTRIYGCHILVDERTAMQAQGDYEFLLIDVVRVKGRQQSEKLFFPYGKSATAAAAKFSAAREIYLSGNFAAARIALAELSTSEKPFPALAACFAARCEAFLLDSPGEDWDGVWDFLSK